MNYCIICPYRLKDRPQPCGGWSRGSIPRGGVLNTDDKTRKVNVGSRPLKFKILNEKCSDLKSWVYWNKNI